MIRDRILQREDQVTIDVDARDDDGQTPLSQAAGHGYKAVVKLLLGTGKANLDSFFLLFSSFISLTIKGGGGE